LCHPPAYVARFKWNLPRVIFGFVEKSAECQLTLAGRELLRNQDGPAGWRRGVIGRARESVNQEQDCNRKRPANFFHEPGQIKCFATIQKAEQFARKNRRTLSTVLGIACSAELHSAVSPRCTRPGVRTKWVSGSFRALQNAILRYGRLKICATAPPGVLRAEPPTVHSTEIRARFSSARRPNPRPSSPSHTAIRRCPANKLSDLAAENCGR